MYIDKIWEGSICDSFDTGEDRLPMTTFDQMCHELFVRFTDAFHGLCDLALRMRSRNATNFSQYFKSCFCALNIINTYVFDLVLLLHCLAL